MSERETQMIDGVEYVIWRGGRYAKCCGWATCTSECKAIIHHGPGHQSKTHCHVKGEHEIHEAVYGSQRQFAEWKGQEVCSGFFDEPPRDVTQ